MGVTKDSIRTKLAPHITDAAKLELCINAVYDYVSEEFKGIKIKSIESDKVIIEGPFGDVTVNLTDEQKKKMSSGVSGYSMWWLVGIGLGALAIGVAATLGYQHFMGQADVETAGVRGVING